MMLLQDSGTASVREPVNHTAARIGSILPKTEVKKALKKKPTDIKHPTKKINEDIILDLTESKKVYIVLVLLCLSASMAV